MQAIAYTHTGPVSVLELTERPVPEPAAGEVRVRVVASGVNPTDWKARRGAGPSRALPVPQVPNQDGAGVIDAIGAGVTDLSVGQRVWLWHTARDRTEGTAQEYVAVPTRLVAPLPDDESFDTGASLGIPALTAHRALTAREGGPDRLAQGSLDGCTVLVTGGAGAVGHAAIQLAVWAGATVIATVSGDHKAKLARSAGAHHVINYRTEDTATHIRTIAPAGIEIIVDVNVNANLALDLDVVATNGTISIYADAEPTLSVPVRASMTKNVRYQFILTYTTSDQQKTDAVAGVGAALADGALRVGEDDGLPVIRYPLAEAAAAHQAAEDGVVGKVLIHVTTADESLRSAHLTSPTETGTRRSRLADRGQMDYPVRQRGLGVTAAVGCRAEPRRLLPQCDAGGVQMCG